MFCNGELLILIFVNFYIRTLLLLFELVVTAVEDVLHLVGQQEADGAGGDVLAVAHLHQLPPLVVGEIPPGQARVLLVQGASEQTEVVTDLAPNHVLLSILLEGENNWLLSVGLRHCWSIFDLKQKEWHLGID